MTTRWWHTLLDVVPAEEYRQAARSLSRLRLDRDAMAYAQSVAERRALVAAERLGLVERDLRAAREEITNARARLLALPDLEGPQSLSSLVAEVSFDHETLTDRLEAVQDYILSRTQMDGLQPIGDDEAEWVSLNHIAGIIEGKTSNVPDTPEEAG